MNKTIIEVKSSINTNKLDNKMKKAYEKIVKYFNRKSIYNLLKAGMKFLLPKKRNTIFKLNIGGGSFTDGKEIVIGLPEYMLGRPEKEIYSALKAITGHESEHINSSNFEVLQAYLEEASEYLFKNYKINKELGEKVAHYIANSIEDGRIEKRLVNRVRGYFKHIKYFRGMWWKNQPIDGDDEYNEFTFAICTVATTGLYPNGWDEFYKGSRAEQNVEKVKPLIIKGINASTAQSCCNYCMDILRELDDYIAELLKDQNSLMNLMKMSIPQDYNTSEEDQNSTPSGTIVTVHFKPEKSDKQQDQDQNNQQQDQGGQGSDEQEGQEQQDSQGGSQSKSSNKENENSEQSSGGSSSSEQKSKNEEDKEDKEDKCSSSSNNETAKDDKSTSKDEAGQGSGSDEEKDSNEEDKKSSGKGSNDQDQDEITEENQDGNPGSNSDSKKSEDKEDKNGQGSDSEQLDKEEEEEEDEDEEQNSGSDKGEDDKKKEDDKKSSGAGSDDKEEPEEEKNNSNGNDGSNETDEKNKGNSDNQTENPSKENDENGEDSQDGKKSDEDDENQMEYVPDKENGSKDKDKEDGSKSEDNKTGSDEDKNNGNKGNSNENSNQNANSQDQNNNQDSSSKNQQDDDQYGDREDNFSKYTTDADIVEQQLDQIRDEALEEAQRALDSAKREDDMEAKKKQQEDQERKVSNISASELDELAKKYKNDETPIFHSVRFDSEDIRLLPTEIEREAKKLEKEIKEILINKKTFNSKHQRRGILDTNSLWQFSVQDYNMFQKKSNPKKSNYVFYIIEDGSYSMTERVDSYSTKWFYCCKASAIIEEAIKKYIPFKVATYTAGYRDNLHYVVKDFNENSKANKCWNFYHYYKPNNGNKDGHSIRVATKELLNRIETNKVLIILSDGLPSAYKSDNFGQADVRDAVREARKNGVTVISIAFGSEAHRKSEIDTYKSMYQSGIISCDPSMVTSELIKVFKKEFVK